MNTVDVIVDRTPETNVKSAIAQTFGAGAAACPRCKASASRPFETTEWITMHRCTECGWKYATAGGRK
jgi:hypothetical protein